MWNISMRYIGLGVIAMATACFAFAAVPAEAAEKGTGRGGSYYYVAGGVKHPGVYKFSAKRVTLKQAVVAAGIDRDRPMKAGKLVVTKR